MVSVTMVTRTAGRECCLRLAVVLATGTWTGSKQFQEHLIDSDVFILGEGTVTAEPGITWSGVTTRAPRLIELTEQTTAAATRRYALKGEAFMRRREVGELTIPSFHNGLPRG